MPSLRKWVLPGSAFAAFLASGIVLMAASNYPLGLIFIALSIMAFVGVWCVTVCRWSVLTGILLAIVTGFIIGPFYYDWTTSPASSSITFYEMNHDPIGELVWKGESTINLSETKKLEPHSQNFFYFRPGVGHNAPGVTLKDIVLILRWKADLKIKLRNQRPDWDGPTTTPDGYVEYATRMPDVHNRHIEPTSGWLIFDAAHESFEIVYRVVGNDDCQRKIRHNDLVVTIGIPVPQYLTPDAVSR